MNWCNRSVLLRGLTASLMFGVVLSFAACGGSNTSSSKGCYVNGTYYPNGNAPNDQCVCPPIGPCTISFPATAMAAPVTRRLSPARDSYASTVLANGRILVLGGLGSDSPLASAELYDPATGNVVPTGEMTTARYNHTATLLANGQVLVAGGLSDKGDDPLASAEIYDPATGTLRATGSMNTGRCKHTATLLADGEVLVAGGRCGGRNLHLVGAELYDPVTGTFRATGSITEKQQEHGTPVTNYPVSTH